MVESGNPFFTRPLCRRAASSTMSSVPQFVWEITLGVLLRLLNQQVLFQRFSVNLFQPAMQSRLPSRIRNLNGNEGLLPESFQIVFECRRSLAGARVLSKHIAMLRIKSRPASVTSSPVEFRRINPSCSNGASEAISF